MMRDTGCDGVVVGRGCLGRPWLFRDLARVFAGEEPDDPPTLGEIGEVMLSHARLLASWIGEGPAFPELFAARQLGTRRAFGAALQRVSAS